MLEQLDLTVHTGDVVPRTDRYVDPAREIYNTCGSNKYARLSTLDYGNVVILPDGKIIDGSIIDQPVQGPARAAEFVTPLEHKLPTQPKRINVADRVRSWYSRMDRIRVAVARAALVRECNENKQVSTGDIKLLERIIAGLRKL